MNAPFLSLVPPVEPPSQTERLMAHGQMTVAIDAFEKAAEALHSAAYWFEKSAQAGGGHESDVRRFERANELLRETRGRVQAGLAALESRAGRRA